MEKRAKISIVGVQKQENEKPNTIEFITYGILCRYGTKLRVSYKESDLTGMSGVTTAFVVDRDRIYMERSGKLNSRMEFVVGSKTECMYNFEGDTFVLGITARKAESTLSDDGGKIYLEYGLELERKYIGSYIYDINVLPAASENPVS